MRLSRRREANFFFFPLFYILSSVVVVFRFKCKRKVVNLNGMCVVKRSKNSLSTIIIIAAVSALRSYNTSVSLVSFSSSSVHWLKALDLYQTFVLFYMFIIIIILFSSRMSLDIENVGQFHSLPLHHFLSVCEIFIFSDYKRHAFAFFSFSRFVMRPQATIFCVFHGHRHWDNKNNNGIVDESECIRAVELLFFYLLLAFLSFLFFSFVFHTEISFLFSTLKFTMLHSGFFFHHRQSSPPVFFLYRKTRRLLFFLFEEKKTKKSIFNLIPLFCLISI